MRKLIATLTLIASLGLSACATGGPPQAENNSVQTRHPVDEYSAVRVDNQTFDDVQVTIRGRNQIVGVRTVSGNEEKTFAFHWPDEDMIYVQVLVLTKPGANQHGPVRCTGRALMSPGFMLDIILTDPIIRSTICAGQRENPGESIPNEEER